MKSFLKRLGTAGASHMDACIHTFQSKADKRQMDMDAESIN